MGRVWLAVLCGCAAQAAVISGVVVDRATGRPLARSSVTLVPIEGTGEQVQSARAGRAGQFRFTVNAGMYLVRASRTGFAPFQYGQKNWKSAAKPVAMDQDGSLYLEIRMRRYGAITGTLLDKNELAIPEQKVVAYAARQPLEIAGAAISDDRGIYRIHGLEPGTYYVRSAASLLDDGSGLLPTFHKQTMAVDQSITADVDLDQQAEDVDIHPLPGKLFRVKGRVSGAPAVTVSLISDTGRVQTRTTGPFDFEQVAPGNYELIAETNTETNDAGSRGKVGAYQKLFIDNDSDLRVPLNSWQETEFRMQDEKGNRLDAGAAKITARRKTLDRGGRPEVLKPDDGRAALGPGRWEIMAVPPAGYYVVSLTGGAGGSAPAQGRADGWNEIVLRAAGEITIKISSRAASIHGVVRGSSHAPVPGAPVYLDAFDRDTGKRVAELRVTRTDLHGQYHFASLPPGLYRILSTFDYESPDAEAMHAAGVRPVTLAEAADTAQDLDLYIP